MSKRKAFNFYHSYFDVAKELPEKDRLSFLWAILERQFEGTEPDLKGISKLAYISQKHNIDSQVVGYEIKTGLKLAPTEGGRQGATEGGSGQEEGKGEVKGKEKGEYTPEDIGSCGPNILPILLTWLEYKRERKETYKSIGLKTLIKKFNSFTGSRSELELIVEASIMNNYSGIVWDRHKLKTQNTNPNPRF